jgi:hypothetical protein
MYKMTRKLALQAAALAGLAQLASMTVLLSSAPAEERESARPARENVLEDRKYNPIEAMTYALGANKLSGYFQPVNGKCAMTLMLFKNVDAAADAPDNAASRVQVSVAPGEQARVDSAEGEGVKLNCNSRAETVTAVHFDSAKAVDISENTKR